MGRWIVAGALALLCCAGYAKADDGCQTSDCTRKRVYQQLDAFGEALGRIQKFYIHAPDNGALIDAAIAGMASSLDPHSSYLTAAEFKAMQARTNGSKASAGLTFAKRGDFARVIAPIAGGPAAAAGIKAGDIIAEIDGMAVDGESLDHMLDRLQGPEGSTVKLTVLHAGAAAPQEITLTRRFVQANGVSQRVIDGVGYVKISQLTPGTSREIEQAFAAIKGVKAYILDLRDDPGGLFDEAVSVADLFLDSGEIISQRARTVKDGARYTAHEGDIAKGRPIVILINEGTAAGAEIIAGALQARGRAKIVGMPSFGTGTVQTMIPLANGGALKITTSEIILPSGRSFQGIGLLPDVAAAAVPKDKEVYPLIAYTTARREAALSGHLPSADKPAAPNKILYPEKDLEGSDFQLAIALGVAKRN